MGLEKILNLGKAALFAGAMLVSGCVGAGMYLPFNNTKHKHGAYLEAGVRGNVNMTGFPTVDAGGNIHTIPVHPDDGGPSMGSVTTEFESDCTFNIAAGLECSYGTKNTRVHAGIDGRLGTNFTAYERQLQPLPPPYESYGWSRMEWKGSSYIPFVGVSQRIAKNFVMGFEMGWPSAESDAEAGHHRNNMPEAICGGTWEGFGRRYCLNFTYEERYSSTVNKYNLAIVYETYEPDFGGERGNVESFTLMFSMPIDF